MPLPSHSRNGISALRALPFTFHLGLLPIVVIFWAWADSIKQFTSWDSGEVYDPSRWVRVSDSAITFERTTSKPSADPMRPLLSDQWYWRRITPLLEGSFGKVVRSDNNYPEPSWFPPFQSKVETRESAFVANDLTTRSLVMPFWLILAIYLPL